MDHLVYLDYKSKELNSIILGAKDVILRGATGRKLPYGRVKFGDTLYFCENNGDNLVKAQATVLNVTFTDKLSVEESEKLVDSLKTRILLNEKALKRFRGKRYLSIIEINNFEEISNFAFDKSSYGNMDDWLLIEDISNIK